MVGGHMDESCTFLAMRSTPARRRSGFGTRIARLPITHNPPATNTTNKTHKTTHSVTLRRAWR